MEHELIDWLDDDGNYKGVVDKAVAHTIGLWHRSVHVWIVNDNGEVLLQQRCKDKSLYPNYWDCSFAGHVGAGEDPVTSVTREGEEELGLIVNLENLEHITTLKEELRWGKTFSREFVDVYVLHENINANDLHFQAEEVAGAKWFDARDVFKSNPNILLIPHTEEFNLLKNIISPESTDTEVAEK